MIEPFGRVSPALALSQDGSNGDSLPIGTIIAYNGPLSAIPVGWHLCDGSDGTPDLRGRFLEGSDTPGIFLEAALPNLVGNAWYVPHDGYYNIYGNGVLYYENQIRI